MITKEDRVKTYERLFGKNDSLLGFDKDGNVAYVWVDEESKYLLVQIMQEGACAGDPSRLENFAYSSEGDLQEHWYEIEKLD